jgi:hypothetical protein
LGKIIPSPLLLDENLVVSDRRPDNTMLRNGTPVHIDLGQPEKFNEDGFRKSLEEKAVKFGIENFEQLDDLLPQLTSSRKNDYLENDLQRVTKNLKTRIEEGRNNYHLI